MYPDSPPAHAASLIDLYLTRWQWGIEIEHWRYNSSSSTRCTGVNGEVDCSGGCVACANWARAQLGLSQIPCQASWEMARECHSAPRPKWMQDRFGVDPYTGSMTVGLGISADQANVTPGALGFHGPREGMDGFGNSGHVKSKWFLNDGIHPSWDSVEAMGTHAGVGFSTFLDSFCTYFAIPLWLADQGDPFGAQPQPLESDMQVFICPNKPVDKDGNTPHAEFWPAGSNPFLPNGGFLLHWGASLNGDQGKKNPNDPKQRVMVPQGGGKWIGAAARGTSGLMVVNDVGHTSGDGSLGWS